jgi:hypothetical protein
MRALGLKYDQSRARMQTYWLKAQQKCETLGGYLAEPKTAWYVLKPMRELGFK